MKRYIAIAVITSVLAGSALAQNKVFSSAPNQSSMSVKQLEANIDFLQREYERLHRQIRQMKPTVDAMSACAAASKVYAPGAAGSSAAGCAEVRGTAFVSEIKATGSSTNGGMTTPGGTNPGDRMQNFINANGCLTSEGWHPCTDDEVIFALDQQAGGVAPGTIIDGSTYWVRSLTPYRFDQTSISIPITSLNCSGWTNSGTALGPPYAQMGTMFDGNVNAPMFNFGQCSGSRKVLCCR